MKIASWNVNSLNVRLPQVLEWLAQHQPAILGLQETKLPDDRFPAAAFADLGWHVCFSGQPKYNGVALVSRAPMTDIVTELPGDDDPQRRVLGATVDGVRVYNLYVPNGQSVGSEKYAYKLAWLDRLADLLEAERARHDHLVVAGDFNIAPADDDVHDPQAWAGQVHCSEPERAALRRLGDLGLKDTFRLFEQPPQTYSWWDYRAAAYRRNRGLRIDLILASPALAGACTRATVDTGPREHDRPSDHAPVFAEFDIERQVMA